MAEEYLEDVIRPEEVFAFELSQAAVFEAPAKRGAMPLEEIVLPAEQISLPAETTPLVGRERELEQVCALLRDEEVRLLTLTGAGGTGKTRLAQAAASKVLGEYPDGVVFVPLAAIRDPNVLPSQIAKALSLKEVGGQPLVETLKDELKGKRALLLLDNFEQLLEKASVLGELLQAAAGVEMLVTSRFALRLQGEHEYVVPPLSVPDPARLPPLGSLAKCEAVALFLARAKAAEPGFCLTDENAPAVAAICVRLDGLPLALELAATRIKLLSPEALVVRLEQRLPLLTGGARDLPAHQQTLRDTIAWSYELLAPQEQRLFWRLAVFSGGFTLGAAEAICNPKGDLDVLEGVGSLIDKSLLRRAEGEGDEPRFGMLATIHEYASERLSENVEAETIRDRHAEHFLKLAEEARKFFKGPHQAEWFARLEQEHDNLRAALEWCSDRAKTEWALRLTLALAYFWWVSGRGREQLPHYERALELSEEAGDQLRDSPLRGELLMRLAEGAYFRADTERSSDHCEQAVALFRRLGDESRLAISLNMAARCQSDYHRRRSLLEEGLALSRKTGDLDMVSMDLSELGLLELVQGDAVAAAALLEEGLRIDQERGDDDGVSVTRANLGFVALERDLPSEARAQFEESIRLSHQIRHKYNIASAFLGLAVLAMREGSDRRSAMLLSAAAALTEDVGEFVEPPEKGVMERTTETIRERLGEERFQTMSEHGSAMTLDEAVAYALTSSEQAPEAT